MSKRKFALRYFLMAAGLAGSIISGGGSCAAQTEQVLHYFTDTGVDGYRPLSDLTIDSAGNVYGTTYWGGLGGTSSGTVFELTPAADGTWIEKVLHSFSTSDSAGYGPNGGVILDNAGNIYGSTYVGPGGEGGGVFELVAGEDGKWKYKVLHVFNGVGGDGLSPIGSLVFDSRGNLYGSTWGSGSTNAGVAYELTPNADGSWTEKILYRFCSQLQCKDGARPTSGLAFDGAGNLYGVAGSGSHNFGVVFELMPTAEGVWKEKVVHNFAGGADGAYPFGRLVLDKAGHLYGTTYGGGATSCTDGCGTVFELTPTAGGGWGEKVLHSFGNTSDGSHPYAGPTLDVAGNLYGTTFQGGPADAGTVYELSPTGQGVETEKILYRFPGHFSGTAGPTGGLTLDAAGILYGATQGGGKCRNLTNGGCGYVFEILP